jgi:hypothetical protein
MSVVPLTLTISLCLVFTFVIFFLREHARGTVSSAERDSLLPLAEEDSRVECASPSQALGQPTHAHQGAKSGGCDNESRAPRAGYLRRG